MSSQLFDFVISDILKILSYEKINLDGIIDCPSSNEDVNAELVISDLEGDFNRLIQYIVEAGYTINTSGLKLKRRIRLLGDYFGDLGGNGSIRILIFLLYLKMINGDNISLIVGNRDMILLRIPAELFAWQQGEPITPYWCNHEFEVAVKATTTPMEFFDVVARLSMGAPNLAKQFKSEIEEVGLNQFGDTFEIIYELFMSPTSLLTELLLYMNVVDIKDGIMYTHIPPTTDRIMRNFDGTIFSSLSIQDWVEAINSKFKSSVMSLQMNGGDYLSKLKILRKEDLPIAIWTSGKSTFNNMPGSLLFRAAMGTNPDGTPTHSLQQGVSIENIDGYTQPLDQSYLYDFGITTTIHAHKPHTGFSTRFTNGVTSIGIDSLRVTNAIFSGYDAFGNEEQRNKFPKSSTHGYHPIVWVVKGIVSAKIHFPKGCALYNIDSKYVGRRYGPWSVISDNCQMDDGNSYVMLAAQYEKPPIFQLRIQFVKLEEFLSGVFDHTFPI